MYNPYPNPVSKTKGLLPYFKIRFLWRRQNLKNANLRRSNLKFWAQSLLVKLMHRRMQTAPSIPNKLGNKHAIRLTRRNVPTKIWIIYNRKVEIIPFIIYFVGKTFTNN